MRALSNYVAHGCGYDWTVELGAWDMNVINDSVVQTLIAFFILVVSAGVLGKFFQLYSHQLAGYMLLGFVCASSYMLGMVRYEYAVNNLHYICVFCKAYIAFETGTHLANASELKQHWRSIALASLGHVVCVFCVTFAVFDALISDAPIFSSVGEWGEWKVAPMLSGSLATATAIAIGVVMTAAEPTCCAEIIAKAHATGLFTAAGLRSTSGITILSVFLFMLTSPIIANLQHSAAYWMPTLIVSLVLTLAAAALLWRTILLIIHLPLKSSLTHSHLAAVRSRADETDRFVKMAIILVMCVGVFALAELLDSLPAKADGCPMGNRNDDECGAALYVESREDGADCKVGYRGDGGSKWGAALTISFQPWPACFIASTFICNEVWTQRGTAIKWRLLLQPWSQYVLLIFGTLSGSWIPSAGALGGPGLLALAILAVRVFISWGCALATIVALRLPYKRAAGLDRVLQAQVALCFLWELHERSPALQVYPFSYASVGGAMIFLEVLVGVPLHKLALWIAGEDHNDKVGKATVLGAEGAPPVITLKLIDWEVRAGANGSHVGELVWTVRDTEITDRVDERSVRRILLNAKPDAFVSMMQDDKLNYDACQLLQGTFDMPRCIVQCLDPEWEPKFQQMSSITGAAGDVCMLSNLTASMRNLLDQFVQSAQSAIMLLHDDPGADVIKVTITEKEKGMLVRDMKLPEDIQVLTIQRNLTPIVPHGHTKLQNNDEVMICGRPNSLASVTAMKKGKVVLLMGR